MTKTYLVRMTPLEPFTFGGEKGFGFEADRNTSYYQTSKDVPEQTTIIGMLRYIALDNHGMAKRFESYTDDDRKKMEEWIGKESFSFENTCFTMGKLKSVSPVFITDGKSEPDQITYYIRNPLCNQGVEKYEPMKMEKKETTTSNGTIRLPERESYNTKTVLKNGYLNIGTKNQVRSEYVDSIVKTEELTGNRKNGVKSDEDGFYKREVKMLNDDLAFAVFVECEDRFLPEKTIAYMGLKKSAFMVDTTAVLKNDLTERIQQALGEGDEWYYAISDMMPVEKIETFSIIAKKQIRNLQTKMNQTSFQNAVQRSRKQFNLIAAGSVFYQKMPEMIHNDNFEQAGYNCVVKIGGAR